MSDSTLNTYNNSAKDLAKYFAGIGARTLDIQRAFSYFTQPQLLSVIELGCGDGRDAVEIAPYVKTFVGSDYSTELIKIAQKRKIYNALFEVQDMRELNFKILNKADIIFAFASLLHLNKTEVRHLLQRSVNAINKDGIWYISLKYLDHYQEVTKHDEYGERQFYFYNPEEIIQLAGPAFVELYRDKQKLGSTDWFTLILKKAS